MWTTRPFTTARLTTPTKCSTFVLMEVETLGVARSLGWKVHMRCANGYREDGKATMLGTTLNFAAALAGLIAAWRWYQTTTIRPPTELPYGSPTTIDTGPLVAFIKEIARLNRRAASWTAFAALLEGVATIAHYYGR